MNVFSFSGLFYFQCVLAKTKHDAGVFVKMIPFQNDVAHNWIHEMTIELAD